MRCIACNEILSAKEATRKSSKTGEFLDLCSFCIKDTGISYTESLYLDELDGIDDQEGTES